MSTDYSAQGIFDEGYEDIGGRMLETGKSVTALWEMVWGAGVSRIYIPMLSLLIRLFSMSVRSELESITTAEQKAYHAKHLSRSAELLTMMTGPD